MIINKPMKCELLGVTRVKRRKKDLPSKQKIRKNQYKGQEVNVQ